MAGSDGADRRRHAVVRVGTLPADDGILCAVDGICPAQRGPVRSEAAWALDLPAPARHRRPWLGIQRTKHGRRTGALHFRILRRDGHGLDLRRVCQTIFRARATAGDPQRRRLRHLRDRGRRHRFRRAILAGVGDQPWMVRAVDRNTHPAAARDARLHAGVFGLGDLGTASRRRSQLGALHRPSAPAVHLDRGDDVGNPGVRLGPDGISRGNLPAKCPAGGPRRHRPAGKPPRRRDRHHRRHGKSPGRFAVHPALADRRQPAGRAARPIGFGSRCRGIRRHARHDHGQVRNDGRRRPTATRPRPRTATARLPGSRKQSRVKPATTLLSMP